MGAVLLAGCRPLFQVRAFSHTYMGLIFFLHATQITSTFIWISDLHCWLDAVCLCKQTGYSCVATVSNVDKGC